MSQEPATITEARALFKPVTEQAVRDYTDSGSFERGRNYLLNGAIYDAVLRGNRLQARCEGRREEYYDVRVRLVAKDAPAAQGTLADWDCTCMRGGFCKHLVALALTWVQRPADIEVRPDPLLLLQTRPREELVRFIGEMLQRAPDLYEWLDLELAVPPAPSAAGTPGAAPAPPPLDMNLIQGQIDKIFRRRTYEWREEEEIAGKLQKVLETGRRYAAAGAWHDAFLVYERIAQVTLKEGMNDENGEVDGLLADCGMGIRDVLAAQAGLPAAAQLSPGERRQAFHTLYDIWKDIRDYGIEMDEAPASIMARLATTDEKADIEAWVRADMKGTGPLDTWYRGAGLDFIHALRGGTMSEEDLLAEYQAAGLWRDAANLLIELDRADEALRLAGLHLRSFEATQFADYLLRLGPDWRDRALAFVEDRLWEEKDLRLAEGYTTWLQAHYLEFGLGDKALRMTQETFRRRPSAAAYEAVQEATQLPGQRPGLWEEVRPGLRQALEQAGAWDVLVEIYLHDGEVRAALDTLRRTATVAVRADAWGHSQVGPGLLRELAVAKAAEGPFPAEARAILQRAAERIVEARARDSYGAAADYLVRIKALYAREGDPAAWDTYIADLRTRTKLLRAFRSELDARKLGT